jgi:phospholipase C
VVPEGEKPPAAPLKGRIRVLDNIDHVVLLMVENRSFDSTVGWLYKHGQPSKFVGADQTAIYQGLQTGSYSNVYDGTVISVTDGTKGESGHEGVAAQPLRVTGFDPHETYEHVNQQLFGSPSSPTNSNPPYGTPAGMAGFAYDYDAFYESWEQLNQIMEAYTPEQLPILNGLAGAYAVSDAWHSSVPTQTNPNRAFSLCGTSLGRTDNTWDAVEQFDTKTIWNALPDDVTWGVYYR